MRTIEEVEKQLRTLRLHGMAQTLQARCLQAQQNGSMSVLDVLTQLVQDELDCRQSRLIERRFHSSGLDERKIMQDFDWSYNPRLPRQEILELISGKFVQNAADALLVGHPGTGKSHIAKAVAHAAIRCREAAKLGFTRALTPRSMLSRHSGDAMPKGIEVMGVRTLQEALDVALVK